MADRMNVSYPKMEGMSMGSGSATAHPRTPTNTNKGKHPIVSRISKHPVKSLTSRKSQQMKGGC
jgi:hypothetical protein